MLLELKVKDFGIIEQIDWQLDSGLNVITGETGAGKSLVIDAVEALLTGKINDTDIRYGTTETLIEATFRLEEDGNVEKIQSLLADSGIEAEKTLVLSGELRRQGRSTFRLNGRAIARGVLEKVGDLLIDIHGQSEHLSLLNKNSHLNFLDSYAHTLNLREQFSMKAAELHEIEHELNTLIEKEKESARQAEFFRFQIEEIRRAELKEGEEEILEKEQKRLVASEKLKKASYEAYQAIYGDDNITPYSSALDKLNEAVRSVKALSEIDDALKPQLDYLQEALGGIEEAARDIRKYNEQLEYNPQRLTEVGDRLELIKNHKKKYGDTIASILDYLGKAESQLEEVGDYEKRGNDLQERRVVLKSEMGELATRLSKSRKEAAHKLVSSIQNELAELNMSGVIFDISINQSPSQDGLLYPDGNCYVFNRDGADMVEFRTSTNPGEPLKPLEIIASTGEMSRFMLALKSALAEADRIPVLIFDEIDIGVGGRSGDIVGKKLFRLARGRQAICVTHLPQIAAFADSHFSVQKIVSGERTMSIIEKMGDNEHLNEMAVMLAGPNYTEATRQSASELIMEAVLWKQAQSKDT